MARALVLAERGRASTRPNPVVGAVVVVGDEIVGEGWHAIAGGPHAEIVALQAAGLAARGATVYTTLEPCNHRGRTGPCTQALIEAGVERLVYALDDPNPQAAGGASVLRDAGIDVDGGVLADWAAEQNEVFLHVHTSGRPHVTLKLAQTLDGELRSSDRWITGRPARVAVHRRRALSDAVLVGSGTVLDDDPRLDVRHVEPPARQPRPVVLDARGRTPLDAQVVRPGAIVVTTAASPADHNEALLDAGVAVEVVPAGVDGGVDVAAALNVLLRHDVHALLIEGGELVTASFVAAGLVDVLVLHIAVTAIGPSGLPAVAPATVPPDLAGWRWKTERAGFLGRDLEVVAVPERL